MPDFCTVTGTVYHGNSLPAGGKGLSIIPLGLAGEIVSTAPNRQVSNLTTGVVSFNAIRGSNVIIEGRVYVNGTSLASGVTVAIPNAASANLLDLVAVTTIPSEGLTVKDEGSALPSLIGTFDFVGSGVAVTQTAAGVARVTITSGGGFTAGEVDGSPTFAATDLQVDQSDGFVLTNPSGTVARLDLNGVPYARLNLSDSILNADINSLAAIALSKLAALTASRALVSDESGIVSVSGVTATELTHLSGVTSGIQGQLNGKLTQAVADALYSAIGHDHSGVYQPADVQLDSLAGLSYSGNALKVIRVNAGADSFELATVSGGGAAWGGITGTLADQTDLQTALDAKANLALSNLASVAINTSLLSDTDNTDDLGSASKRWKDLFLSGAIKGGSSNAPVVLSPHGSGAVLAGSLTSFTQPNTGFDTLGAAALEIGNVTATSGAAANFAALVLGCNTSNTSGIVGSIYFTSRGSGSSDKRTAQIYSACDGALNSGYLCLMTSLAGSNTEKARWTKDGHYLLASGYMEMSEISDPGNSAANKGRLYMRDNGSGKTQLVAVFPSGAVQVIATEP